MKTRFYFHLVRGRRRLCDRIGAELSDEGLMSPGILDVAKEIWPGISESEAWTGWSIEITDSTGRVVRAIALLD